MASRVWVGASGIRLPPDLVAEHAARRQHLHARYDDAVVLLRDDPQGRDRQVHALIVVGVAGGLRRQHGVGRVYVVAAHMLVVVEQVAREAAIAAVALVEHLGLHRHAGDEARDVVVGAPDHAVGQIGDAAMRIRALLQIGARGRPQVVGRVPLAALLVGHDVAVGRVGLHVVERGHRVGRVPEGGMGGDVVDLLAADIDPAPVANRLQVLLASLQHGALLHGGDRSAAGRKRA